MRVSCYIKLSEFQRDDEERRETPILMQLTSAAGCGGMGGTVVVDRVEQDIYVENLRTDLPLSDEFCSDFIIAAYARYANSEYLAIGDIHCPLPNLAAVIERWYKPVAGQQKVQQIAHALRLAAGGMRPGKDGSPPWHLEVRNITDPEEPEQRLMFVRVHYRPLGLELAAAVAAADRLPTLTDEIISNDLLLPTWMVRVLMLRLYQQYAEKKPLPIEGSSLMRLDFEAAVKEVLPAPDAKSATALIARAIHFHAQPS